MGDTHLSLRDKGLTSIEKLDKYKEIRKLDISFNLIKKLEGLDKVPKLKHLAAYCCALETLEGIDEYAIS